MKIHFNTTHGLRYHPLYTVHATMLRRCYNPKNVKYHRYGGRGIIVEPFLRNVKNYIEYVESLALAYGKNLTLDRINNELGYTRGNLRWASPMQQANNRSNNSKTKYIFKQKNRYIFKKRIDGKVTHLGSFITLEKAEKARNTYIKVNNLFHNEIEY